MPPTSQRIVVLFLMLMLNEFSASSREHEKADLARSQHATASLLSPTPSALTRELRDEEQAYQRANNQIKNNDRHGKFIKSTSGKSEQDGTEGLVDKVVRTLDSKHPDQGEGRDWETMFKILPNTPPQRVASDLHAPFEESTNHLKEPKGDGEQSDALHDETAIPKNTPKNGEGNRTSSTKLGLRQRREVHRENTSSSVQLNSSASIQCSEQLSCRNRCTTNQSLGQRGNQGYEVWCYCDSDCEMFQDCCADYDDHCSATNVTSRASPDVQWKCVSQGRRDYSLAEIAGIWMISSCPKSWLDDKVRSACLQFPDSAGREYEGPVPVTATSGATFTNRFCAQCNGFGRGEIAYYDLFYERERPDLFFWHPRDFMQRRYCLQLNSSCTLPNISRGIQERCEEGTFRIVREYNKTMDAPIFKNRFCLQCTLGDDRSLMHECGPKLKLPGGDIGNIGYFIPLFRPATPPPMELQAEKPSSCTEAFDRTSRMCHPGITRPALDANSNRLALLIWIKPHRLLRSRTQVNQSQIMDSLHSYFGIDPGQVSNVHIKEMSNASLVWFDVNMERAADQITEAGPAPPYGIETLLNFTVEVNFTVGESKYDIYKANHWLLACADYDEFLEGEYAALPLPTSAVHINRSRGTERSSQSAVYINRSREILHSHEYFANKTKKLGDRLVPVGKISVCRLYLTANCPNGHMSLQENEYTVFPNGSLYRNASREYISPGRYDLRNRTAWICTDDPITDEKANVKPANDGNFTILTIIGLSVSIFSLVVFLLTYSLFAELRTLPGVNLMNLSVSLLLLHSLWLAADQTGVPLLCTFIAASIHFLALASFTWMSIIAFNTWYVFSRSRPPRLRGKSLKRKILKYMAIGWVPPLIFVLICATLDKTRALPIGYGADAACFMQNQRAGLCLLGVPVAISVVFNAVFLLKTVGIIRRTSEQTRSMAIQSRNRVTFKLYARLAVLMGFTWVFGFLAYLFSYYYLLYPFVVLNTLQGVYIAVAYLLKTRVKELYRELFRSQTGHAPHNAPPHQRQRQETRL